MVRIHRLSVMIYGSMQATFMETKHNGHVHRYGTPIRGNIVAYVSKPINDDDQILQSL